MISQQCKVGLTFKIMNVTQHANRIKDKKSHATKGINPENIILNGRSQSHIL